MPAPISFSKSSKRVLMGAVYICIAVVVAAAAVKAKDTQMVNKAKEIIAIYQADPGFKDPSTASQLLSFHKQGLTLATGMLMSREERNDAFAVRDALFMQAYEMAPDAELASLMESHQALFDPGFRQEQLNRASQVVSAEKPATLTDDAIVAEVVAPAASTPETVAVAPTTIQEVMAATDLNGEASQAAEVAPTVEAATSNDPTALLPEAEGGASAQAVPPNATPSADQTTEVVEPEVGAVDSAEPPAANDAQAPASVEPPAQPATPVISDKVRRATTTTLTVGQQAAVQTCFALLTERYNTESKMSPLHLILDSFLGSRSCN
jgi:hypothetical protein